MWPFSKKSIDTSLEAQLREIRDRLEALERGAKGVRLEWEDTFMRLEKLIGRLTGALKRSQTHDPDREDPDPGEAERRAPRGNHTDLEQPRLPLGTHELLNAMRRKRGLLSG